VAATDSQLLYGAGPFGGIKAIPGVFNPVRPFAQGPVGAQNISNADIQRNEGALTTAFGRLPFINFPGLDDLKIVTRFDVAPARPYWIAQDHTSHVKFYDLNNQFYGDLGDIGSQFTQAVQCDGNVYLNNGQQIFVTPDPSYPGTPQQTLQSCEWQYPPYTGTPTLAKVFFEPGLAAETYYYAFTVITTIPTINGNIFQESAPIGANSPFPFKITIKSTDDNLAIQILGIGGGINADGLHYKIGIYRMSTNQPVWFQVTTTSAASYIDNATDQSISGNQQLNFSGQPPPLSGTATWPIAEYLDRMWVFAKVNNANTNNVPQTQLWYSNVGQGWNFDAVAQVLLVGNESTTPAGTSVNTVVPYGSQPTSLIKFGSFLIAFRSADSWFVTGQDENTFQVITLFDSLGCIAPMGPVVYRGILAWPSDTGFWAFDGTNLTYISADIWLLLQSLTPGTQSQMVGFAWQEYLCWSFPADDLTLRYNLNTQQWDTLPYATTSASTLRSVGSNPLNNTGSQTYNQVVAVRPRSIWIDAWFADPANDLSLGITTDWTGPYSDGDLPHATKNYRYIVLSAPWQPGVKVNITLHRDFDQIVGSGVDEVVEPWTGTIDLGDPLPFILPIPAEYSEGTVAALDLSFTSAVGGAPIQVWKVEMYGSVKREFAQHV
jgi:hypothetical protein